MDLNKEGKMRSLQFLPLIIFLLAGYYFTRASSLGGFIAYAMGGASALFLLLYLWDEGITIDYIALGSNLYILYLPLAGIIMATTNINLEVVLVPLAYFRLASFFLFILITGLITTAFSPSGFIQYPNNQKKYVLAGSVSLLVLVCIITFISYTLDQFWAGLVLPFFAMLVGRKLLRNYFMSKAI